MILCVCGINILLGHKKRQQGPLDQDQFTPRDGSIRQVRDQIFERMTTSTFHQLDSSSHRGDDLDHSARPQLTLRRRRAAADLDYSSQPETSRGWALNSRRSVLVINMITSQNQF